MPLVKVANFIRPAGSERDAKAIRCPVKCGQAIVDDVLLLFEWEDLAEAFLEARPDLAGSIVDYRASKEEIGEWLAYQYKAHGARSMAIDPRIDGDAIRVDDVFDILQNLKAQ